MRNPNRRNLLRLCLFWVKIISGNAFPEMRVFGWSGKFYFPEIDFRWPKKKRLWLRKWISIPIFTSNEFRRERERESESARGRSITSWRRSHVQAPVSAIRKHQRRQSRSEIANSPSRRSWSARCFARSRSTAQSSDWSSRSTAPSNPVNRERQSGCCVCFSGFIFFLVAFSKHQKIFFGKFFEIQPNT